MIGATEILRENNDWITLVFLIIFILLAIAKFSFKDKLLHTSSLILYKKYLLIYFNRDKNIILNKFQALLFVIQLLAISMFFYIGSSYFIRESQSVTINDFYFIFGAVAAYFCLRYFVGWLLALALNINDLHTKIVYDKISYFANIILWILPLLLLSVYASSNGKIIFSITLIIFTFLLVVRYVLFLANNKKLIFNNLFYFILYLCALEIAPLMIILKSSI
jgi:hypothetical protein